MGTVMPSNPMPQPSNQESSKFSEKVKTKLGRAWSIITNPPKSSKVPSYFNEDPFSGTPIEDFSSVKKVGKRPPPKVVKHSGKEAEKTEKQPPPEVVKQKKSPMEGIKQNSIGKRDFGNMKVPFSTLTVIDQSTKPEWNDKCGYHSLKNAIAASLIHLGLGTEDLFTETAFYDNIYRSINDARPPALQGGDVDIATLNSFLKAGSPLDEYIKTKTGNQIGIEQIARSISLFNYEDINSIITVGDKAGLHSLFNYLQLNDKLGKKDQPFVHHVVIGSGGHWVTLSLVQDEKGVLRCFGMDSWKNKTDRYDNHIKMLNKVSKNSQAVLGEIYEHYDIGRKVTQLVDALKNYKTPLLELRLLLDREDSETLESPVTQNLVCKILGLQTREAPGAKYVLQQLGFPSEDFADLSENEQEAGKTFLRDTLHFPTDSTIPLNPDPIASLDPTKASPHLHAQLKKEFRTIYDFDLESLKNDYPQHYFLTKVLELDYNSYEKIPVNLIAERLLKRGVKDLITTEVGVNYPSISESIDFMRKAGWLHDETERTKHANKIVPFIDILKFYQTHDPTNEKIISALKSLEG